MLPRNVLLMDPAIVFWLSLVDSAECVEEAVRELNLNEHELILCPINDGSGTSRADSGTHWSLLVCWPQHTASVTGCKFAFRYYDSLAGLDAKKSTNFQRAVLLAQRLTGNMSDAQGVTVIAGDCAQQTNSYDCGMYVLQFSEIVVGDFLASGGKPLEYGSNPVWERRLRQVRGSDVAGSRSFYRQLLLDCQVLP
jgi:Ulp1 family protease